MSERDLLLETLRSLGDATVAADEVPVRVPGPVFEPEDDALGFQVTVGLYDLLVERSLASCENDHDREELLRMARTALLSAEPGLRFALAERSRRTEELERAARMRGRQNALTGEWLVPRLEQEIDLYEARIRALERAIEGRGR